MSAPRSVREAMPELHAWLQELYAAFGADHIRGQIARGMKGEVPFWLSEGGHELGKPSPDGVPLSDNQINSNKGGK